MAAAIDSRNLAAAHAGRIRFMPDLGAQGNPLPIPPPIEEMSQRFPISTQDIVQKTGPDRGIPPLSPAVVSALEDASLKPILMRQGVRGARVDVRV